MPARRFYGGSDPFVSLSQSGLVSTGVLALSFEMHHAPVYELCHDFLGLFDNSIDEFLYRG